MWGGVFVATLNLPWTATSGVARDLKSYGDFDRLQQAKITYVCKKYSLRARATNPTEKAGDFIAGVGSYQATAAGPRGTEASVPEREKCCSTPLVCPSPGDYTTTNNQVLSVQGEEYFGP